LEECWPYPVFANYTLAFALKLRKSTEKPLHGSRRDSKYTHYQDTHTLQSQHTHTHTHTLQNNLKPLQYKLKQTQYKIYPNEIITI
jgi:hypothetical protein